MFPVFAISCEAGDLMVEPSQAVFTSQAAVNNATKCKQGFLTFWAVLSDEQMSNEVRVEHQPGFVWLDG